MTKKITKLTEEQRKQIPVYRDMWLDIGTCCDPIDFEAAKVALAKAYQIRDLEPPKQIYYAKGPKHGFEIFKSFRPNGSSGDYLNHIIYGSHDASWLAFYSYFKDVCNLEELNIIDGLVELAKCSGWVWVDKDEAIIMERHNVLKFDDQKRTHCEDGPAIAYPDGTEIFVWHGVRVDRKWIMEKDKLTAKEALSQTNLELRRVACEIVGWAKILKDLKSRVIDQDPDETIGTLLRVNIPDVGEENFLQVRCGTGRQFAIPVPPEMKTAAEANAWTFGLSSDEIRDLEVRT